MRSKSRFPAKEHLRKPFEFKEVMSKGVVVERDAYRAYVLISPGRERKAGFVAGRSVGSACKRNRARRLLREAYRRLKANLIDSGFQVIFVAKRAITDLRSTEVMADMASLFERHGLTRNENIIGD